MVFVYDPDRYQYTEDLMAIAARKGCAIGGASRDSGINTIVTPLRVSEWEKLLLPHPDRQFVDYLLDGMKNGFRIGFNYLSKTRVTKRNMKSAYQHPEVVQRYIDNEVRLGRVRGPLQPAEAAGVHISRFGVIPKPHQPGKWRMIVDLSHPVGLSVNDGIDKSHCSLTYLKLDQVAETVMKLGRGAMLAKIDIQSAYRVIPVHPQDRTLLGMKWQGNVYVDAALPFGLRSAPKIFNAVADALEWIVHNRGVRFVMHYLDDFIIVGAPESSECGEGMDTLVHTCDTVGLPLVPEKCEGPTCRIVYLGIEIDSNTMCMHLPREKLNRLVNEISKWSCRKACTRSELQSLTGQLQHAAVVVKPGRTFLRRMYDLLKVGTGGGKRTPPGSQHLRLNMEFRSDLAWWSQFLCNWNGVSLLTATNSRQPDAAITSDASGSWGCGAYWGSQWLQWQWDQFAQDKSIAVKELLPIIFAAALWGKEWRGWCVLCRCDNQTVVAVINTRSSHDKDIMHLLRVLFFIEAHFDFMTKAVHIPGAENKIADDISRNRSISLSCQVLTTTPAPIPEELINLLIRQQPDWTCNAWTRMFSSIFNKD